MDYLSGVEATVRAVLDPAAGLGCGCELHHPRRPVAGDGYWASMRGDRGYHLCPCGARISVVNGVRRCKRTGLVVEPVSYPAGQPQRVEATSEPCQPDGLRD